MADAKISALAAATDPTGAELLELVQGGVNVQSTVAQLLENGTTDGVTTIKVSKDGDAGYLQIERNGIDARHWRLYPRGNAEMHSGGAFIIATSDGAGTAAGYLYLEQLVLRDLAAGLGANVGLKQTAANVLAVTNASTGDGRLTADAVTLKGTGSKPTAGSAYRGMLWYTPGGAGVADMLEFCFKDNTDTYSWVTIL